MAESQVKHPALKGGASGLNGNCTMRQLTLTPMSDIASTSRSPSSRGPYTIGFEADVLRGVLVPVVDNAASKTCPFANGQRHLVAAAPATRARLGRRKKSPDSQEGLCRSFRFVLAETGKHPPSCVRDGLRQGRCLYHSLHVQVLDGQRLVFVNQLSRELMQKVFTDVLHPLVASGNEAARLVTRLGAFLFSGKFTLLALEIPFSLGEVFRIGEMLAVPGNGKIDQPTSMPVKRPPSGMTVVGVGRASSVRIDA